MTTSKEMSRTASTAAFLGSVVEYYDLVAYGTAAALVFKDLFFKGTDTHLALLLSLATFASGYLVRPLGGIVFGWLGDRKGRRHAVLWTIVLMGAATILIGLLPTYDTVGWLAPILLVTLRLCQGLAVGGELGGSILIAVEHAPKHRRGFFGSWATAGAQGGTVLATVVFALTTLWTSESAFLAWGWRIPFLLSAVVVLVGLVIRYRLEETPDFQESKRAQQDTDHNPLLDALRAHGKEVVCITAVMAGMMSAWYILTVYSLSYATGVVGIDKSTMLWVVTAATALVVVMNPFWGHLSDRIGRMRLLATGLVLEGVLLTVYFIALRTHNVPFIILALMAVAGLGHAAVNGIFPAFIVDVLPARVRYTAGSLGMQLAAVIAGFAPLVAVALEGSPWGVWSTTTIVLALCGAGAVGAVTLVRGGTRIDSTIVQPAAPVA